MPTGVPAILLAETPAPAVPNEDTMTDNELGVFLQNQDKALAACNADKAAIAQIVTPE